MTLESSSPTESVPSLAAASTDDADAVDHVSRVLFPTSPERQEDDGDDDGTLGYSQSLVSFDDDDDDEDDEEEEEEDEEKDDDDTGSESGHREEDPSTDNGASSDDSNSKDSLFGSKSPVFSVADSSHTEATTEVTSNRERSNTISWERKVESLQRENSTLKDIITADSESILQLKAEISTLRYSGNAINPAGNQEYEELQRERNGLLEQEAKHIGMIQLLERQLTDQSSLGAPKEVQQLRLENELFATQIIENEIELREARRIGAELSDENAKLRSEIEVLRRYTSTREQKRQDSDDHHQSVSKALKAQVETLAKRLAEMENDLDQKISDKIAQSTSSGSASHWQEASQSKDKLDQGAKDNILHPTSTETSIPLRRVGPSKVPLVVSKTNEQIARSTGMATQFFERFNHQSRVGDGHSLSFSDDSTEDCYDISMGHFGIVHDDEVEVTIDGLILLSSGSSETRGSAGNQQQPRSEPRSFPIADPEEVGLCGTFCDCFFPSKKDEEEDR